MMLKTYTEQQVAELLGCSASALRRMRRENRGPTRVGRLVRYPEAWLIEFIEQNASPRVAGGLDQKGATRDVPQ